MNPDTLWEYLKDCVPLMCLGVFGGFVSIISGDKKITVRLFFGGLLLSAFIALMVGALLGKTKVGQNELVVYVGMSCYCCREVTEIIRRAYIKKIKAMVGDNNAGTKK